jgi:hypothetical protein
MKSQFSWNRDFFLHSNFSNYQVSFLGGRLHDTKSTQVYIPSPPRSQIHPCFIQFQYLYAHTPGPSCISVGFGQYHITFNDLNVNKTFLIVDTFSKKNGSPNFQSSMLLFIATNWLILTSLNMLNLRKRSSPSFKDAMQSVASGCCFFYWFNP